MTGRTSAAAQEGASNPMDVRLCLVSTPGPICDATCATIAATPNMRLVAMASGALSATQRLQLVPIDLILLDANLPEDEVTALLIWLADHVPNVRSVVARATTADCNQALAFGADAAIRRDELAAKLRLAIAAMFGSEPDSQSPPRLLDEADASATD